MVYVLVFPFGGALAARLYHRFWQAWSVWGGCCLLAVIALWIAGDVSSAVMWTAAASVIGFLGPELWASCRGFMSHPRVFGWIAAAGFGIFVLMHQEILGGLLLIGIVFLGFRTMLRPLIRRR